MKKLVTAMLAGAAMAFSLVTCPGRGCRKLDRHMDGQRAAGMDVGLPGAARTCRAISTSQTIRQVARASIGGNKVRIVLSNEYGKVPLKIGAAHIGADRRRPRHPARLGSRADVRRRELDHHSARRTGHQRSRRPRRGAAVRNCRSACTSRRARRPTAMHWDGHQTAFVAAGNKVGETDVQAGLQADAAGVPVGDPGGCAGRTPAPS